MPEILRPKIRKWVPFAELADDIPPERWPNNVTRASGRMPCEHCGQVLDDHYQPAKATCPTLVIDCQETWWKL